MDLAHSGYLPLSLFLLPLLPPPPPSPSPLPRPPIPSPELLVRQKKGLIPPETHILVVDDPRPNIGSGSATLNAIVCVAEYLAARDGFKVRGRRSLAQPRAVLVDFPPCAGGHR